MLKVARLKDRIPLWLSCTDLYYGRGAQGVLLMKVRCATSQLVLPSLTKLSVAGCGRLKIGVLHWATSVDYCKWLIIDRTFCCSRFSTGRLLAIEDFTFTFLVSARSFHRDTERGLEVLRYCEVLQQGGA